MTSETPKSYLAQLFRQAITGLGFDLPEVTISMPQEQFGDYSTNSCLILAKQAGKNPQALAEQIVKKITELDKGKVFDSIAATAGFINARLSLQALIENFSSILKQKEKFGSSGLGKKEKILVEYFQPNIAKPLHLGHLRTAVIGDALFRILQFCGYKTESDTHLGDWGTQFGLLLCAYKQWGNDQLIEKNPIDELNQLYVKIHNEMEKDLELREKGKAEFVKLEQGDKENRGLWKKFTAWSWQEFEIVYSDLGIRKSDHNWGESFFEDKMPKVVEELKQKGLLKESQGAQIVDLNEYNLGVAVIIKSDGGTTYLLRDLATYIYRKSKGFVKQLYVVDVRQSHTLAQTFKILELIGHIKGPHEAVHVAYGFLTLPEGAMSTRKGTAVGAKEFILDVQNRALDIIKEKNPDLKNKEQVAKKVATSAIKYFDLSHNLKSDIVFEPEEAITFEGNTGPYLQYTYARIHGILRKSSSNVIPAKAGIQEWISGSSPKMTVNNHELAVLRKLHQFPEIVEQVAVDLLPNILCNYLFELSQTFNTFYQAVPVLQEKDENTKSFRLQLIIATAQVIQNGLHLLGIEAPEEM